MRMELIDTGFSQRLVDRHTDSHLFEIDFPAISHTMRDIARIRSLELVYALTHLVLRQEITNSFAITKKIVNSVKQMWNVSVHLEFPLNRCEDLPSGMKRGLIPKNYQLSRFTGQKPPTTHKQSAPSHRQEHAVTSLFSRHFPGPALSLSRRTVHAESHRPIRDEEGRQGSPGMVSYFRSSLLNLIHPLIHRGLATNAIEPLVTSQKPSTSHEQSASGHRQEHTDISLFNRYFPGPARSLSRKTVPAESYGQIRDEKSQGSPGMVSYFRSSLLNLIHPLIHGGLATNAIEPLVISQKPATTPEQSVPGHRHEHTVTSLFTRHFPGPALSLSRKTIHAESHRPIRDEEGRQGSPGMVSYFRSSLLNLIHPLIHRGLATNAIEPLVTSQKPSTSHEQSASGHRQEHTDISLFTRHFPGPALSLSWKTVPAESYGQIRDEKSQGSPGMVSYFRSSLLNLIHPLIHGGLATNAIEPLVTSQKPATTPEQSVPGHRHEHTVTSLFTRHFPGPALSQSRKTIHAESHRPIRDEGQQGSPEMISYFRSLMVNPTKTREYQLSRFTGQKPATTPEQSVPGHRQEHVVTSLFSRHFPGPALSLSRKTIHAESHRPIRDEGQQGSPEMISYFRSSMVNLIHPLIHGGSATKTREYQLSRFTGQKPATTPEQSVPGHRRQEAHTPSAQGISGFSTPFSVFSRSTFFPGQKSVTPERQGISLFSPKNDVTRRPHEPRDASEMIPYLRSTGEAAIEDGHMHLYHRSPATTPYMWHSPGSNNEPGSVSAENTNIYHTHPEIEHVTSTHTEIVNERVIERESDSKPLHATPQPLSTDVDRMADQIYQLIERRTRIERERRGL